MNKPVIPEGCKTCGKVHEEDTPHIYEYRGDIDEDLFCEICLQPFNDPTDLPCGHTYCAYCLETNYRLQHLCPLDRRHFYLERCRPSCIIVRKFVNKLMVKCPRSAQCPLISRGNLRDHLRTCSIRRNVEVARPAPQQAQGIRQVPCLRELIASAMTRRCHVVLAQLQVPPPAPAAQNVIQNAVAQNVVADNGGIRRQPNPENPGAQPAPARAPRRANRRRFGGVKRNARARPRF